MKHILKFMWVYVAYLAQVLVFNDIKIFHCSPDIILTVLVLYSIAEDYPLPTSLGAFAGLLLDVFGGKVFGINTLIYMYFALCVSLLTDRKSKNSPGITSLVCFISIAVTQSMIFVVRSLIGNSSMVSYLFAQIFVKGSFGAVFVLFAVLIMQRKANRKRSAAEPQKEAEV